MRSITCLAAVLAVAVAGPAHAALAVKPDATPERLGQCAIAMNQWKGMAEAQNKPFDPRIAKRLAIIMAADTAHDKAWDDRMADAMRDQLARFDALTGVPLVDALQVEILSCEAVMDTDQVLFPGARDGPWRIGAGRQVSRATPSSYAGYCYLALKAEMSEDQESKEEMAAFALLMNSMGDDYSQSALDSMNNRGAFYLNFKASHTDEAFKALVADDLADCRRFVVPL